MNLVDEIKAIVKSGGILTKLIAINLAVFLAVNIIGVIFFLSASQWSTGTVVRLFAVPASLSALAVKPWTLFTYMFLHEGFLHILFNILWLYWFGIIFLRYFSQNQLLGLYIIGGLFGGIFYILSFNLFPVFKPYVESSVALGASASVIAIVIATALYIPNYSVNIIFLGSVKLKWIALVMILLDIIGITSSNSGGHLAHLGGAVMGWIFISAYKKRVDLTKFVGWFKNIKLKPRRKKKSHLHVTYRRGETEYDYNARKRENQKQLDAILEKIKKSGYNNLTAEEKRILFDSSKKRDL
ncbi:MAG TPA: rhomboid family intramembrane serine protease [Salinivirgaceae bacterium]|nr:rhomboid family intramembrane serine protease [Salinivirgaceae bacterium]